MQARPFHTTYNQPWRTRQKKTSHGGISGSEFRGKTHALELIMAVIEDICLIIWYPYKFDI
jgi:hypothetical protein